MWLIIATIAEVPQAVSPASYGIVHTVFLMLISFLHRRCSSF
jgi:hypothetical protein